jgi:hypothetical protein
MFLAALWGHVASLNARAAQRDQRKHCRHYERKPRNLHK